MTSRLRLPDARWMADHRSTCVIENEIKNELNAKNTFHYTELLQKNGEKIFSERTRKVPVIQNEPIQSYTPSPVNWDIIARNQWM